MTITIQQISVGYDTYEALIANAVQTGANTVYPPYNVRKTSNTSYAIDLDVSGFHSSGIKAYIENGYLSVSSANAVLNIFNSNTDVFFNKGITLPEDFNVKFWIADGLKLASAVYGDGIITFGFDATENNQVHADVPIVYSVPVSNAGVTSNVVVTPVPVANVEPVVANTEPVVNATANVVTP